MAPTLKHLTFLFYQFSIIWFCSSQNFHGDRCRDSSGKDGTCSLIDECPAVQSDLRKGIRPVNCGFQGTKPIVCCPAKTVTQTLPTRVAGETAKYWCDQYSIPCTPVVDVVGGEKALPNEFPHMAAVGYGVENDISWNCGGTLISDKFVLTAAHCMSSGRTGPARWILLGAEMLINSTSSVGKKGQIHPVVRRIRHPGYKPPSKYNDIALLEIGKAVTPNALEVTVEELHPACLPSAYWNFTAYKGIATGWGRVGHGDDGSSDLLKVKLDILELSKCNELYEVEIRTTKWLERGIDKTMLCSGVLQGGKDTCQGDSGGPLQYSIRGKCMYEVWGVTSFGKICAFANSPAIYTSVREFIPWIESIVWPG